MTLFKEMLSSGSTSVPLEATAKVRSSDLLGVVYVIADATLALNILRAVSLVGATSH